MKKGLLFMFMLFSVTTLNAQMYSFLSQTENKVGNDGFEYEEIVQINQSKSVLWINLKKWISSNFSSYNRVVDMEDKDAGVLVVKWRSGEEKPYSQYWTAQYEATYQIDVRENKYRIKIYNSSVDTKQDIDRDKMKLMSTPSLKQAIKDLEIVVDICKSLQGTPKWNLDNRYLKVMETNSNYEPTMKAVKNGYQTFNSSVLRSLKDAMSKVDDF